MAADGGHAGIAHEECLHAGQFPQGLGDGHTGDEQDEGDRHRPQHAEPAPADADLRHDAGLGGNQ